MSDIEAEVIAGRRVIAQQQEEIRELREQLGDLLNTYTVETRRLRIMLAEGVTLDEVTVP